MRRFHPLIMRIVLRTARAWGDSDLSVTDDLVQETYLKLCADNCRLLRLFRPQQTNAFYGYLKVVTANVVHDHFKNTHAAKRGAGRVPDELDDFCDQHGHASTPRLTEQQQLDRTILMQQIDRELAKSSAGEDLQRNRIIFWLYYRDGLTANAIASFPGLGLTPKGVESALLRLTRSVREGLHILRDGKDQKGLRELESF